MIFRIEQNSMVARSLQHYGPICGLYRLQTSSIKGILYCDKNMETLVDINVWNTQLISLKPMTIRRNAPNKIFLKLILVYIRGCFELL